MNNKKIHMSDSEYAKECDRRNRASREQRVADQAEAAVVEAERIHGWMSIQAADARSAYQGARYAAFNAAK